MPNLNDRIAELVINHLEGTITPFERQELDQWMASSPSNREAVADFLDEEKLQAGIRDMYHHRQQVWDTLQKQIAGPKVIPINNQKTTSTKMWRWVAAAAIILFIAGGYFLLFNKTENTGITKATVPHDVKPPDRNRAMITLASGQQIYLDSAENGELTKAGNVTISKNEKGEIVYNGSAKSVEYNTLSNPRGSKVQSLTLSDGTTLWLNAESSVTYPTAFVGNERKVSITGEAYFEVNPHPLKGSRKIPFIVKKGDVEITVLGTHFNVNAYDDEKDIKVTLLEGRVKVSSLAPLSRGEGRGGEAILKPGEQALINSSTIQLTNPDLQQVMAWKNGTFDYRNADLTSIMKQVARWYDVEVIFKDQVNDKYTVDISRNVPVSKLFKYIEMSGGVHFDIEENKIIVRK